MSDEIIQSHPPYSESNKEFSSDSIATYNNKQYYLDIVLYSGGGGRNTTARISQASIMELTINESAINWWIDGTMTISSEQDSFFRETGTSDSYQRGFNFKSTGLDLIRITIQPRLDNAQYDSNTWGIDYLCAIYDIQDITGESNKEKYKKIYFQDLTYQMFLNTNIEWSTPYAISRQSGTSVHASTLSDSDRSMYTGDAIKDLITESVKLFGMTDLPSFGKGFNKGGSKVFYTAPTSSKCMDVLLYLMSNHISDIGTGFQPCVLTRHRITGEWDLVPHSKLAELAYDKNKKTPGEGLLESMFIPFLSNSDNKTKIPKQLFKTPRGYKDGVDPTIHNINLGEDSIISAYSYNDISPIDSVRMLNSKTVHSFDFSSGVFNIEVDKHSIENVSNVFQQQYVEKFFGENPYRYIPVDIYRQLSQNVTPVLAVGSTPESRYAAGRNVTFSSCIFLNNNISFVSNGSTHRTPNTFINIDTEAEYIDGDFEKKILGQWYVTSVKHIFGGRNYINEVVCFKPYTYNKI